MINAASFDHFSNYDNLNEDMDDENKYANLGLSLNRYVFRYEFKKPRLN